MWVVTLVLNMVHKSLTKYMYTTFRYKQFTISAPVELSVLVFIGVGGGGGTGAPPAFEKFQGILCFQGKRKLLKNPEKKYIQYSEFRAPSVFQGKRKLFKNSERKKYIPYSKKISGQLSFSGQALVAQKS